MSNLKRRFELSAVALAAFVLAGTIGLHAEDKLSCDYQVFAERARWDFSDEADNPLFCMFQQTGTDCDVRLIREAKDQHALTIKIIRNDRMVYQWKGHRHSVFRIQGDHLYYADFAFSTTGGHIVAVDLTNGKPLWRSPLKALGGIRHSSYLNRMTIDANDEVVSIYGNESMGRYLEFKDARTGKTVGHRQFPNDENATAKTPATRQTRQASSLIADPVNVTATASETRVDLPRDASWSKEVNGLRVGIATSRYLTPTSWIEGARLRPERLG